MTGLLGGKISHSLPLPEGEEDPDPAGERRDTRLSRSEDPGGREIMYLMGKIFRYLAMLPR
jgi:hypothetical protein